MVPMIACMHCGGLLEPIIAGSLACAAGLLSYFCDRIHRWNFTKKQ